MYESLINKKNQSKLASGIYYSGYKLYTYYYFNPNLCGYKLNIRLPYTYYILFDRLTKSRRI